MTAAEPSPSPTPGIKALSATASAASPLTIQLSGAAAAPAVVRERREIRPPQHAAGRDPITETPSRLVPPGSDDDVPPSEVLLACDLIAVAATVHTPPLGNTQTFCAWVKLDDVLPEVRTWPALSLTEVPLLTSDVDSWSRS